MMKKTSIFTLVLVLLIGVMGSVSAQDRGRDDLPDLTALAAYAPDTAPFFAAIRTDDGYIDTLDNLIADVTSRFPEGTIPPVSVRDLIDEAMGSVDFETVIRPWLGDSMAVYLSSFDLLLSGEADMPLTVAMAVTDRDAADAFVSELLSFDGELMGYNRLERDNGVIVYEPPTRFDPSYLLTPDALLVGIDTSSAILFGDGSTLAQSDRFGNVLDALPEEAYNMLVYLDLATPAETLAPMFSMMLGPDADMVDFEAIIDLLGQQMLGFVFLEDRAAVMDFAYVGGASGQSDPIDLTLLEYVPSNTALLIHDKDLGGALDQLLNSLDAIDALLREIDLVPLDLDGFTLDAGPGDLATFARLSIEGTTGQAYDDVIEALGGDFISYVRLEVSADEQAIVPVSGTVLSSTQPEILEALLEVSARQAQNALATTVYENGMLTMPLGTLFSLPDAASMSVALRDGILVSGRTADIEALLERTPDNLTTTSGFAFEQGLFLPDPSMLWYIDATPLRDAATTLMDQNADMIDKEERAMVEAVLNLISTASITTSANDNGMTARFTITLSN